jgi:hypothetical protein
VEARNRFVIHNIIQVFGGKILKEGLLLDSGVKPGSTLVLIPTAPLPKPAPSASTQVRLTQPGVKKNAVVCFI